MPALVQTSKQLSKTNKSSCLVTSFTHASYLLTLIQVLLAILAVMLRLPESKKVQIISRLFLLQLRLLYFIKLTKKYFVKKRTCYGYVSIKLGNKNK